MNWKDKIYVFTQWCFIISLIWFTVGLFIIATVHWLILILVPVVGLIAVGYWADFTRIKNRRDAIIYSKEIL